MSRQILATRHNLIAEGKFRFTALYLKSARFLQNAISQPPRFKDLRKLYSAPVISSSETELWYKDDNPQNWILTAGKVQNLRIAVKKINGLEIPAGKVFSFWRQIGNPNIGKGFVIGREIREGCIVPTKAGGLCQLSNALYDAALKANFDIIERHRHTKVIRGSLAEQDRDATVKWNYVDLRFRWDCDFRIEAELSADKLIVRFRSQNKTPEKNNRAAGRLQVSKLNDCYSCGNFSCFKHPTGHETPARSGRTCVIADECWPEYQDYLDSILRKGDHFILPYSLSHSAGRWNVPEGCTKELLYWESLKRLLQTRLRHPGANIFESSLKSDELLARTAAKRIPLDSTHLIVAQNLLPFLYEQGALGGRTYDVLMQRLPMEKLQQRLDKALVRYPDSPTLNDFRASGKLIDLENKALTAARKIISPHAEIVSIFNNKSIKLSWHLPQQQKAEKKDGTILFPASAVARKGAYEIKRLMEDLDLSLAIAGNAEEKKDFLRGLKTISFSSMNDISLLIYPTYIEHKPRLILKALAAGIPVIASEACGLDPHENLSIVGTGDYTALKNKVEEYLRYGMPIQETESIS